MKSPELIVILINCIFILPAYFLLYPKFAGSNGNKVGAYDLCISIVVLMIIGFLYWGTGQQFNIIIGNLTWFWFALLTYAALEIPLMLWYYKKNNVWASLK
jgi:hypothetical protein